MDDVRADCGGGQGPNRRDGLTRLARIGVALATVLGASTLAALAGGLTTVPSAGAVTVAPMLYVGNGTSGTITSYPLPSTGNVAPTTAVTSSGSSPSFSLAFDASGDLWTANTSKDTVTEYTPAQLTAGGTQAPAVTISTGITVAPQGVVFDAAGNLWVSTSAGTLLEFTGAQLAASGSPAPTVTISSNATSLGGPDQMAFDSAGDLWVSNAHNNTIVEFTPAQLAATGSPAPAVVIADSSTTHTLTVPIGLAFDMAGDLWVSNFTNFTLVDFTPSQLATSGSPTPAIVVSGPPTSTLWGWQMGFDTSGNLWVANPTISSIAEYSPAQLAAGGVMSPGNSITGAATGLDYPAGIALREAPTVASTSPTAGPAAGGTTVTVHGTGFTSGTTVAFGSKAATTVKVTSPFVLTAVAPAGSGTADVTVSTFAGTSTTSSADRFTYQAAPSATSGYWEVASDGRIFSFGNAQFYGSMGGNTLNAPVVGTASTPTGGGYWEIASDGGVFSFGNAQFYGSMGGQHLNASMVGMAATSTGKGYWEVASDGGIFSFGKAQFYGSMGGKALNKPIVGMAATSTGQGYWEVASDGGIFSFGTATFDGSMGGKSLNRPIVGMAATPTGSGYWEVASDGGIFTYGTATFNGSMGGKPLNKPVVGMAATPTGGGYWEVASDGGLFAFGKAAFDGSMGGSSLNKPIVAMATS